MPADEHIIKADLNFRSVPKHLRDAFRRAAVANNTTMKDLVVAYMRQYVADASK